MQLFKPSSQTISILSTGIISGIALSYLYCKLLRKKQNKTIIKPVEIIPSELDQL